MNRPAFQPARAAGMHLFAANDPIAIAGNWFVRKWRARLAEARDVQTVARQMRKAGIPLQLATRVLATKTPVSTHECSRCHTQYFQPQECDWCPGQQAAPVSNHTER